ncbi:hypothetical protein DEGADCKI_02646 [[Clostridium] scindens]|nr:hypothetical protein DEGADCKI_02646 [[Clostridium] scindens]
MNNMRTRICRECGKAFSGGPRAWYCPECRSIRERERRRKYNTCGYVRKLGGTDICKRCGKEYIVRSGTQRYCEECSKIAIMEIDRNRGLNGIRRMPTHTIRFAMIGARSRRGNAPYAVGNSTRAERP